jgi:hypothetical protein
MIKLLAGILVLKELLEVNDVFPLKCCGFEAFVLTKASVEPDFDAPEIKNILLRHNLLKIILYAIAKNDSIAMHNVYSICGIPIIDTLNCATNIKNTPKTLNFISY